jgi:phage tail-like protein
VTVQTSSYVQYLPTPYQGDFFLGRFLQIFESILSPVEQTVDGVANYFDPRLTPTEFLPWLASWLGIELNENWTIEQRRELLTKAADLLRRQGTRRGMREYLRLYLGEAPLIVENFSGLRLGQDSLMGINSRIGALEPHTIEVTVVSDHEIDEQVVRAIIESQKPTHVAYALQVHRTDTRPPEPPPEQRKAPSTPMDPSQLDRDLTPVESA